jgi:hypothetical protein
MASALTFLKRYHKDSDEFLNHITREKNDETWVSFVNTESKEQSKEWMHTHYQPSRKGLNKHCLAARKPMAFPGKG